MVNKHVPGVFKEELTEKLFKKLYGSVCTRCFGYGVPSTAMVPMGDLQNHHDKLGNNYELVNPLLHLRPDKQDRSLAYNTYFSRKKFMNDYSLLFAADEIECYPTDTRGKFDRNAFGTNEYRRSLHCWKIEIKLDRVHIWDLRFEEEEESEDDDSVEEEGEDGEEEKK